MAELFEAIEKTLKPCPFCGGKARIGYVRDGKKVRCEERTCMASGPPQFHGPLHIPSAEERAAEAWNKRSPNSGKEKS